jgi:hypothetical protein
VNVSLTLAEFDLAVNTARLRIVASAARGLNHATTYKRNVVTRLHEEVVGACGEIAVGKAFGEFFVPSVNTFHERPDVMRDVEVRATDRADGCLIVRDNDDPGRRYVLAIVDGARVELRGWLRGSEAQQERYLRNPNGHRPAWFVPQSALRPACEMLEEEDDDGLDEIES